MNRDWTRRRFIFGITSGVACAPVLIACSNGGAIGSTTDYDRAAAELRRPGRQANDGPLDKRELVRLATLAASSHNTQPWKFHLRENAIAVLPDFTRRCAVVDPDDAHLYRSLGCAAENLVHAAAAQGHAAAVSFDALKDEVVVRFERSTVVRAGDLFRAIPSRQCTKTAFDGTAISIGQLKVLEKAGTGTEVRTMMLTARAQLDSVTEYVTQGNEAQLGDPGFRKELVSWIRFNPDEALRAGDGLAGRTNGQPALPTWLGKRLIDFVLTPKSQIDADARNISSAAGIAVFVASRDDKAAWVEVGRAYERFALQAAALDLRSAFINQPIEVRPVRPQFEAWLGLRDEHAQLIVRFGRAPLAPFSLRRPVEDVLLSS